MLTCNSSNRRRMSTVACKYAAALRWSPHSLKPWIQKIWFVKAWLSLADNGFRTLISFRHAITSCSSALCLVFNASSIRSSCSESVKLDPEQKQACRCLSKQHALAIAHTYTHNKPAPKSSPAQTQSSAEPSLANYSCNRRKLHRPCLLPRSAVEFKRICFQRWDQTAFLGGEQGQCKKNHQVVFKCMSSSETSFPITYKKSIFLATLLILTCAP